MIAAIGEIAADVQRQVAELADLHTKELSGGLLGHQVGKDGREPIDRGKTRRRRVMA